VVVAYVKALLQELAGEDEKICIKKAGNYATVWNVFCTNLLNTF
jgi:hypothetical protein